MIKIKLEKCCSVYLTHSFVFTVVKRKRIIIFKLFHKDTYFLHYYYIITLIKTNAVHSYDLKLTVHVQFNFIPLYYLLQVHLALFFFFFCLSGPSCVARQMLASKVGCAALGDSTAVPMYITRTTTAQHEVIKGCSVGPCR